MFCSFTSDKSVSEKQVLNTASENEERKKKQRIAKESWKETRDKEKNCTLANSLLLSVGFN